MAMQKHGSALTGKGKMMMTDREKVISAVDTCFEDWLERHRYLSPLDLENVRQLKADALALLKEQKTGHWISGCSMRQQWVKCDICGTTQTHCWPYCPNCGAAMLREELKLFD
jgi:hypothetical protein